MASRRPWEKWLAREQPVAAFYSENPEEPDAKLRVWQVEFHSTGDCDTWTLYRFQTTAAMAEILALTERRELDYRDVKAGVTRGHRRRVL